MLGLSVCGMAARVLGAEPVEPPPAVVAPKAADGAAKFGPDDIEVRLKDGSVLRGELQGVASFKLKTPYGVLTVPATEMRRLKLGQGGAGSVDAATLNAAIKDLIGDVKTVWPEAQRVLARAGSDAVEPLFEARPKAGEEARKRIDAALKRVLGLEKSDLAADHIRAAKFEGHGQVELSALRLKTKLGDLTIKAGEVASLSWLAASCNVSLDLEAKESIRNWQDSGVKLLQGDTLAVRCDGSINVFGSAVPPTGNKSWNRHPFPSGALVGKIGEAGETFLIGAVKRIEAPGEGTLYLRVFMQDDLLQRDEIEQASGSLQVQIGSGAQADEMGE
jgi:hypothetical protein